MVPGQQAAALLPAVTFQDSKLTAALPSLKYGFQSRSTLGTECCSRGQDAKDGDKRSCVHTQVAPDTSRHPGLDVQYPPLAGHSAWIMAAPKTSQDHRIFP